MKKLMAFDMDGTLLFDGATIHAENIDAIARWQAAGHLAICDTGKSLFAQKLHTQGHDLHFDYMVLYSGAVVTDSNYRVLFEKNLPAGVVQKVADHLKNYTQVAVYATTLNQDYEVLSDIEGVAGMLTSSLPITPDEIEQKSFIGVPVWVPEEEKRSEIHAWLRENIGDQADIHQNVDFLDVVPKDCTKATGLAWLINHVKEEMKVYTIGDSFNDLPMHEVADHSASFTYSPIEVQRQTTSVVETTHQFIDFALED